MYKKGHSGNPAGRPKGAVTKLSIARLKVIELYEQQNFNPFLELINLYRNAKRENIKLQALIELCSYAAPKLKHVEMAQDTENPFVINLNMSPKEGDKKPQEKAVEIEGEVVKKE